MSGILHPEGGICCRFFHSLVQKLGLFLGIAHRLVGELHGLIDLSKARHTSRSNGGKGKRDVGRQGFTGVLHLGTEFLHLLACGGDLLRLYGTEVLILLFQALEALLCLSDFPLQGVVLVLGDRAVLQSLFRLFRRFLQRVQLFLGGLDLLLERLVLLGQQFCIAGVHFQELVDILQLGLSVLDLGVDAFEGRFQLGSIAADFNCDTFYSAACQCCLLLSKKHRYATIFSCIFSRPVLYYLCQEVLCFGTKRKTHRKTEVQSQDLHFR